MKPASFLRYRYKAGTGGLAVKNTQHFFKHSSGESWRFRIQQGLGDSLASRLEDIITTHGGLVTSRIPLKGIVLVDSKGESGRELVKSWKRKDRPERYFVDYNYVLKCEKEKRMLPLDANSLDCDVMSRGGRKSRRELSQEAKDKLALYLSTKLPDAVKDDRSSKRIYMDLVKEKEQYPWVRKYSWQMFRDHYCKNKKYYDKLIGYIISFRSLKSDAFEKASKATFKTKNSPQPLEPQSKRDKLFVGAKNERKEKAKLKVEIRGKKRKFADDITNISKGNATIDELLRKPLPRFKKQRLEKKKTEKHKLKIEGPSVVKVCPTPSDHFTDDSDEVEVARTKIPIQPARIARKDLWIDDEFRGKSDLKTEVEDTPGEAQYKLSAMTPKLDLDDLRSAVALNSTLLKEDEDTEDEDYVARLLGLPGLSPAPEVYAKPSSLKFTAHSGRTGNNTRLENHRKTEIEILAQDYQFTTEETTLKLAAFCGDLDKTRKFFTRCREIIDGLFAAYLTDSGALNLSAAPPTAVKADPSELKEEDVSSDVFPARNTRARRAARARKAKE